MECLIKWKKRRDVFQDGDNFQGMGDQVTEFAERENLGLTGSPKNVQFIMKDDTNAEAMKHLKIKW